MIKFGSKSALKTCAYGFAALAVLVGTGFATTITLTRDAPGGKIGPGYARMQPIDMGKPDKVVSIPPYSIPVKTRVAAAKRTPAKSIESLIAESAPPLVVAVAPPSYFRPDAHRIY